MVDNYIARVLIRSTLVKLVAGGRPIDTYSKCLAHFCTTATVRVQDEIENEKKKKKKGEWFTLPPFSYTVDGSELGKHISGRHTESKEQSSISGGSVTALKWITRCCPQLPRSLVQKLFRLRQVRKEGGNNSSCDGVVHDQENRVRRVSANYALELGDRIYLPISVQELPSKETECKCNAEELKFLHSLELHKDPAIIVINKPHGMPVQGGIGIKRSLDELARTHLRHEYSEPPRLVHRLDRDSSGILVMGRTQLSATVLHSIFREKTFGASNGDLGSKSRKLQRRYWALVIGSPRRSEGLISMPLGKVVVDNGKSERITVIDNVESMPSQHAVTKYRVIESSHGYTWLELSPLTGRKHQLRVHCAEVLGTPILGDYKYGWQAHRKLKIEHPLLNPKFEQVNPNEKKLATPFELDLENGSLLEKEPYLHLHCKEMVLPDVSQALDCASRGPSDCDLDGVKTLKFVAPLPYHMQRSWDVLHSQ